MIDIIVLITSYLLIFMVAAIVARAVITKQKIIGKPPIPAPFFLLAKILVVVNLTFLLLRGYKMDAGRIFERSSYIDITALALLILGTIILFLSTVQLNRDLIFGLSDSESHKLQTMGLYSISRHPFYLGFIFILLSSCLLYPHYMNFAAFLGAWFIHHIIMVKEEQFLSSVYGEEYGQYKTKVKRYITFKNLLP
jgi:protein-S-isoprenylcysteine O-methyltransferase Ste14